MKTKGTVKDGGTLVAGYEGPERSVQFTKGVGSERQQRRHQNAKIMRLARGGRLAGMKKALGERSRSM